MCELENSWMRRPWPTGGCCAKKQTNKAVGNNLLSFDCESCRSRKANAFIWHWKLLDNSQLTFSVQYINYIWHIYIYIYVYIYTFIICLKLISISDNDADSNSVSILAFSGSCTTSLTMMLLQIFPTITEIFESPLLVSDHSSCGDLLTWAYKLRCFVSFWYV